MNKDTLIENAILLQRAKALVEAACEGCEDLKDAKDKLEDVIDTIDTCIDGKDSKKDKDDDKVDDKTKEVVTEAINALYAKACLCESADDAAPYIQKAEELQKAIEDIPEEKPVVDDEYPADDVTGGEGNGSDSEAIKELVGNDAEALRLLTDDKNSVQVDA